MSALKNTPLVEYHIELGAKMVPHAGWNMPQQYPEGIIAEHRHTRAACSIFDNCHMGEFRLAGPGAVAFADRLTARSLADLPVGRCRYNLLLNEAGGVIDDIIAFRMAEDDFFWVVNAANTAVDAAWIKAHLPESGVLFQDLSADLAKLDLQGPKSADVLGALGFDVAQLPAYFHWITADVDGIRCIISRTGSSGELGYELFFDEEYADQLWDLLLSTEPVMPAGLGARDTLRLEMGYPLHGHELQPEWSLFDSGLGEWLDPAAEREFIGRDALRKRLQTRQAVGVKLDSRRAARGGGLVLNEKEEIIGVVTTGAYCPTLDKAAALCSIDLECAVKPGDRVLLEAGAAKLPGTVEKLPFHHAGTVREKLTC